MTQFSGKRVAAMRGSRHAASNGQPAPRRGNRSQMIPLVGQETIEDRLVAKAVAADAGIGPGQRDLGELSRDELFAVLSGDR